jgi:hypothetical protein
MAGALSEWVETGGPEYTGPFAAPITPAETEMLAEIRRQAFMGPTAGETAASDLRLATMGGEYLTPEANPFLQGYIDVATRPLREAFEDENLQRKALFARAGHRLPESSPFARAQALGNRAYLNAIGDVTTKIAAGAYESERGRQMTAAEQASVQERERARFTFERAQGALQDQALPRLIEQYGIDAGREEFNRRISQLAEVLGLSVEATLTSPGATVDAFAWNLSGQYKGGGGDTPTSGS